MNTSEKQKFATLLAEVMAYYNKDTSNFLIGIWWEACQNVEFEQVAKAINAHVKDAERGQFAPKVADIVRALVGTTTDKAALAWGKVFGAMSAVGAYQDVCFDDAAIHSAVVDCGGWVKMCRSTLDELSYLQHRFCASYKAYSGRGGFEYPRLLAGDRSPDSMYEKRGMAPPKPVLVGNPDQAKRVLAMGGAGGPAITFSRVSDVLAIPSHREAA